jgi:Ion transport protein
MNISPIVVLDETDSRFRKFFRRIVQSRTYDIFILICIIMNTIVLAINWYSQPVYVDDILDYINYSFAIIFAFESIFKIIALGASAFFRDVNNCFDLFIVITSIISSIISIILNVDFGASTTFIRALRITKILKYTK